MGEDVTTSRGEMRRLSRAVHMVLCLAVPTASVAACSPGLWADATAAGDETTTPSSSRYAGDPIGGTRPVAIHVPESYHHGSPVPLVMMLHGYSETPAVEEAYLNITAKSDAHGFIYAMPSGTINKDGAPFWNASDACCNLYGSTVDDSTYLSTVLTEIQARYSIDPKRVYIVGHSNGGFMAYRMACDHADQVAAIVSFAGAMPMDPSVCKPSQPVSTLEIHGTADILIRYGGGSIGANRYPGARTSLDDWVTLDGCVGSADTTSPPLDLDSTLPGAETTVTKFESCKFGGHAELWTITGGAHVPALSSEFTADVIQFLYDHARP
jgi:polyhydroxybutyrate depolymerase